MPALRRETIMTPETESPPESQAEAPAGEGLVSPPCSPIIRVFLGDSTRKPDCEEIYLGQHPRIPTVGEHICVQYGEYEVWRVEHILSAAVGHPNAHIHIALKES